ncbi:Biotin carboxyl carrier protein of acetyl-CoA carboxylase [Senna tora]|uniref:Biotin carboxyl carrier protein of acetyl-CoA carboxylase n=1 Tax=Senna tora TaxID=362788 RepID=A0A834XDY9_9FABA|nr:Biotin carboxyl carrier protein of acetyl-CoA carboxylase [Senna tora]
MCLCVSLLVSYHRIILWVLRSANSAAKSSHTTESIAPLLADFSSPMASCSLGTSNIKVFNLNRGRKRVGILEQYGTRSWTSRKSQRYTSLFMSQQSVKFLTACSHPTLKIQSATSSEDGSEETESSGLTSELIPNLNEVEFLLNKLCDTSSVGELEVKLAGFHLHVVRNLTDESRTVPPPSPPSVSANTVTESPASNGSASTSLAIFKPESSSTGTQRFLDKAADEGLVIISSPMVRIQILCALDFYKHESKTLEQVGFFRRSRTIKGKRAPPSCKEKQIVKEGQVICYVEQLGGELPIESDVSGEIIKILREDGEPVGYGDALIAILPSFPGIKIQ